MGVGGVTFSHSGHYRPHPRWQRSSVCPGQSLPDPGGEAVWPSEGGPPKDASMRPWSVTFERRVLTLIVMTSVSIVPQ